MKCYLIKERLEKCKPENLHDDWQIPYVVIATRKEFESNAELFDLDMDLEIDYDLSGVTRIRDNYDTLTGHIFIPSREAGDTLTQSHTFPFALDEKGIIFLNDDGTAQGIVEKIQRTKRWRMPSIERFIYDFLESIVSGDLMILEGYEKEMDAMEDRILDGNLDDVMERLVDIRSEIMDLRTHYEQLIEMGQELEENENEFFDEDNLRFFRLFIDRVGRLRDTVSSLRDHAMQVRDLYNAQMGEKQNQSMSYLSVIATIFTPLTLITGWFGMNFQYMPELQQPWAYPCVIVVCLLIVIISIIIFKKKKWI